MESDEFKALQACQCRRSTHSFDLGMMVCRVADAPWRMPANLEDMRAFFNYDLNPHKWREYCKRVEQYRMQYTMQVYTQSDSLAAKRAVPV